MDLKRTIEDNISTQHDLFGKRVNTQLVRVLRTIGFDKSYVRAEGAYLYDKDGHRYLDFLAGYGVFNIGRNHPRMKAALHTALDADLASMVQMDAPLLAGVLAEKLTKKAHDGINMVFFTNSGTEANEGALKFAKCATGRPRVIYLDHAFHGLTNGSLSCMGNDEFREGFAPLIQECVPIDFGDIVALETELKKGDVAAFLFEPIQGKGVHVPPIGFLEKAEQLCKKYGTLTIADEVQTGLGRTGKWFAYEHFGLKPDIITCAKALSGGYIPVGAILYNDKIYNKVFSSMERCVVHSNTFGRNSLAMVAGITSLDILEDEGLIANSEKQGTAIRNGIKAMMDKYELLGKVRGKGLMIGIQFKRPDSTKLKIGWDMVHKLNKSLFGQMIVVPLFADHRILTQVAGHGITTVKLLPPLMISDADVKYFLDAFEKVVADCHKFPGGAWKTVKGLAKKAISSTIQS